MKKLLCCLILGWLACLPPLHATQFIPLPIETLAEKSALILHGKVVAKTVQRDEKGRIYTKVDFQVDEVWKGSLATNRFTILQGGGTLGDRTTVITGQAELNIGEEMVAFLELTARGEGVILGLAQGKFEVWKNPADGEKYTRNMFHGQLPAAGGSPVPQSLPAAAVLKMGDLKQRVQKASK